MYTGSRCGLFFSTGSRLLSSRFTGSRWVILLNGFQTIVQQIHRESLGYSSQRVPDYCPVDSQGVAGLFFSTGSTIFQQIHFLNGFQTIVQQIHRESLGYSSQRVLDYCPVDSQGVAGLFFSTGSRLLSSRFSGSRWLFFSTGSRLLSSRFSGSRWVILLNGFQTIVQQIHRESLGYSSQRVLDYCPVDSQGVAGLFFSTGSRLLSSRFTGSRWVILLNGFQNIVQQIHRESLGYSSQRVPDYCPVDSEGVAGSFFSTGSRLLSSRFTGSRWVILSTGSRLMSSRYSQGVAGIFFSTGSRPLSCRFTGSRWVILLNGFQTIVQQVLRESLGHSSQRVLDYCPVDITGSRWVILLNGFQTLSSIFSGSSWVILLNGFKTIAQQIHRESLCHSSQRVLD